MKIVLLDRSTLGRDLDLSRLEKLGEFTSYDVTLKEEVVQRSIEADIIITNKVLLDKEVLSKLPKLKLICITATGLNNVDLDFAKEKDIMVKNAKGYSTHSVAQHTFTMLFELISNIRKNSDYVKEGHWQKSPIFTNLDQPYYEINGKKWGIIGLGEIGERVADIANAFGAQISYYSTSGRNNNDKYTRVQELSELLKNSDIISIHAPLNSQTQNLIGEEELKLLKANSVLLNLGRGGIINENDLEKFIKEGSVLVGLDVLEEEPMKSTNPLVNCLKSPNLLITPHIAWSSIEARQKLSEITEENIISFLNNV